jgi:hypothetical protein
MVDFILDGFGHDFASPISTAWAPEERPLALPVRARLGASVAVSGGVCSLAAGLAWASEVGDSSFGDSHLGRSGVLLLLQLRLLPRVEDCA